MLVPGGSYVLYVSCTACGHVTRVSEDEFMRRHGIDPEAAWWDAVAPRLRCSECGVKGRSDVRKVWSADGSVLAP